MFSNLPTTNFNFLVTLVLSSANTLNWDKSEILSFGSELKDIFIWIQFSTSPVQKPKCITGAVYSTAYFPLSIFFYCASDSAHFSFSTEIPGRIRPLFGKCLLKHSDKQVFFFLGPQTSPFITQCKEGCVGVCGEVDYTASGHTLCLWAPCCPRCWGSCTENFSWSYW